MEVICTTKNVDTLTHIRMWLDRDIARRCGDLGIRSSEHHWETGEGTLKGFRGCIEFSRRTILIPLSGNPIDCQKVWLFKFHNSLGASIFIRLNVIVLMCFRRMTPK